MITKMFEPLKFDCICILELYQIKGLCFDLVKLVLNDPVGTSSARPKSNPMLQF